MAARMPDAQWNGFGARFKHGSLARLLIALVVCALAGVGARAEQGSCALDTEFSFAVEFASQPGPDTPDIPREWHNADTDQSWSIEAAEISRLIAFHNADSYRRDFTTPDGYAPFDGAQDCRPHDCDFSPPDWRISLPELGRLVTFYNAGRYERSATTPDGFAPHGAESLRLTPVKARVSRKLREEND